MLNSRDSISPGSSEHGGVIDVPWAVCCRRKRGEMWAFLCLFSSLSTVERGGLGGGGRRKGTSPLPKEWMRQREYSLDCDYF